MAKKGKPNRPKSGTPDAQSDTKHRVRLTNRQSIRAPPTWAAALLLALAIAAVYGQAIDAPFFLDDLLSIIKNTSIRPLCPRSGPPNHPGPPTPPADNPVSARPLVNFSFAINYAIGKDNPRGYRLASFAIH